MRRESKLVGVPVRAVAQRVLSTRSHKSSLMRRPPARPRLPLGVAMDLAVAELRLQSPAQQPLIGAIVGRFD